MSIFSFEILSAIFLWSSENSSGARNAGRVEMNFQVASPRASRQVAALRAAEELGEVAKYRSSGITSGGTALKWLYSSSEITLVEVWDAEVESTAQK